MIALIAALLPALAAPAVLLRGVRPRATSVLLAVAAVDVVLSLVMATSGVDAAVSPELQQYLRVDASTVLFLLLINLVFFGVATYVYNRALSSELAAVNVDRFVRLALGFMAAANLCILSNHLVLTWVFLEATTFLAAPLIAHGRGQGAMRAAWRYYLFSTVGLAFSFLGFVCFGRSAAGFEGASQVSFFLDQLSLAHPESPDVWNQLGAVLVVLGYGTKLGLAPMYGWLPATYDEAPPSTTALLAGVQFNCALLALMRVLQVYSLAEHPRARGLLMVMGVLSMGVSAVQIIATDNYKKLIAYASINHAGVLAIGLAIGGQAVYGVVVYAVSNTFVKAVLFITAGTIKARHQTKRMSELKGLIKDMPYSGFLLMGGTFALLGFAPFGSFMGELVILSGMVLGGHFVIFVLACLVLTVVFVATGRSLFPMIWGEPTKVFAAERETFVGFGPHLFFVAFVLLIGVYVPAPSNHLFLQVANTRGGH